MNIQDRLKQFCRKLGSYDEQIRSLTDDIENIHKKKAERLEEITREYSQARDKEKLLRDSIMTYYRIAKENTSNDLKEDDTPLPPDMQLLNGFVSRINIDEEENHCAYEAVSLASHYLAYSKLYLSYIEDEMERRKRIVSAKAQSAEELQRVRIATIRDVAGKYLESGEAVRLCDEMSRINREYGLGEGAALASSGVTKAPEEIIFGLLCREMAYKSVPPSSLKRLFGGNYSADVRTVMYPCGYSLEDGAMISVKYTRDNADKLYEGIQALALNIIRAFDPSEYKITLIDRVFGGDSILGPVSRMKQYITSCVNSEDEAQREIIMLADHYRNLEPRIGYRGVYEYNANEDTDDKIPYRLLIINRDERNYSRRLQEELLYLENNSKRFGITIIDMTRGRDGYNDTGHADDDVSVPNIKIATDEHGQFEMRQDGRGIRFKFLELGGEITEEYIESVVGSTQSKPLGTKYFDRFPVTTPKKSVEIRRPIEIPFAVDENDKAVCCSFEREQYAAYMMGSARSGKTTLLNEMITHLIMNYHPDELELWLMDFKTTEFKRYDEYRPPHMKYLLLEKSQDLVLDIIDKMVEEYERRVRIFRENNWIKQADIPPQIYMPVIFVIIDEFSQMSQIIHDNADKDYPRKLENLLRQAASYGFKFIFSDQTYTNGVRGLTQEAKEQINLRFALYNNDRQEIKNTLYLSGSQMTEQIEKWISTMPVYHTLFQTRDEDNNIHFGLYRNMYVSSDMSDTEKVIGEINRKMKPAEAGALTDDSTYIRREAVCISGKQPLTWDSMMAENIRYESALDEDEMFPDDVLMYAGVPVSFNVTKPFLLKNGTSENILLLKDRAGSKDLLMNVIKSLMNSYGRMSQNIEIWGHKRSRVYSSYKMSVFAKAQCYDTVPLICERVKNLKTDIISGYSGDKLIVILGYDSICDELAGLMLLGSMSAKSEPVERTDETLGEAMKRIKQTAKSPQEMRRMIDEYNASLKNTQRDGGEGMRRGRLPEVYDIKDDLNMLLHIAPQFGVHFLVCFENTNGFMNTRLPLQHMVHKIYLSMAESEARAVGARKAGSIEKGTCLYTNGSEEVIFRPHIYPEIRYPEWRLNDDGIAVADKI